MSGLKRITLGEITQGKSKGDTLKRELDRLNEVHKSSAVIGKKGNEKRSKEL